MTLPPANWYTDPDGDGLRYWDGVQWTDHRAPGPDAVPAPTATVVRARSGQRPRWRSGWVIAAAIFLLFVVIGAIGNTIDPADSESTSTKTPSAEPSKRLADGASPTLVPSTSKPSPSPSKSTSPTPSTTPIPSAALITGYGATKDDWLATHAQAPGFDDGSAFLPYVTTEESDSQPEYAGVDLVTPVVSYIVNLPSGTSLAEAEATALAEFPPGATFGHWDKGEAACSIATIRSPPVEQVMRSHGWEDWVPGVVFSTVTADTDQLDPNNVTSLNMMPIEDAKNLGFC
ncbi:DUF2510 domain-containing protein [Nocardioides sp. LS1]|uniref:DUF2510 domain-containing protein n=1 Tax=Nocardioides sp. LS1 TaxID=1027620 RepID=UPI001C8C89BE|nr:DUF2510 domain-containing protein [Nocardioides sp. LS1]